MKLKRLLIPLILILFFSCEKESYDYKLRGNIKDTKTMAPIQNAQVILYQNSASFWGVPHKDLLAATETDEQGNYGFKFRPYSSTTSFSLEIKSDSYFDSKEALINKSDFDQDISGISSYKGYLNVTMRPKATLVLKTKNVNPYNSNDFLRIYLKDFYGWYHVTSLFSGIQVENLITATVSANEIIGIASQVIKNNITTNDTDSVYCPLSVTTTYYLNY